jgi:hypothetical protein
MRMASRLSASTIGAAVEDGLGYLGRTQRPSGEFATYVGPSPDLGDGDPYPKSVYISTIVLHALGHLPAGPAVSRIRQRIGDFLDAEEEDNGTWNFDGRGEWRIPVDVDPLSCAMAALIELGRRPPAAAYRLLWQVVRPNETAPGGPYYSYVGVIGDGDEADAPLAAPYVREVDLIVNANVLFLGATLGIALPGTTGYLAEVVRAGDYADRSRYCISSHFPVYLIGRASAAGKASGLEPAIPAIRRHLLTGLSPIEEESSAFNLACRAVSLLNLGDEPAVVEPYLEALLRARQPDGGWPVWAAGTGFPLNWNSDWWTRWPSGPVSVDWGWCWGSPALTTALALEAFGKYLSRTGEGQ